MAEDNTESVPLDTLASALHGDLITPDHAAYDEARSVWNGMIDKFPRAIAKCKGVADVIDAVEFARDRDIPLSIRGGGHNVAGTAILENGLVIDLSEMRGVHVDPDDRSARVQGGAIWADADRETQAFGLATPGGVVSDTGVAGLTLGGGIGHLRCKYGLSCDNLRSVEMVTANGDVITASEDQHEELFWGIRGGGGGLGVVTEFEFELHPVGPEVATSIVFYPGEEMDSCLRAYREYVASAPDEVSTLTSAGVLPDHELFSDEVVNEPKIAIIGCYAGPPEEGETVLAPLGQLGEPIADFSATMPYADFQQLFDEDYPDGMRYYWKSLYLDGLPDDAISRITEWATSAPSPLSTVDVWELGGAIAKTGREESVFPGRNAPYLLGVEANWEDPDHDNANIEWVRECLDDMRQFSDGSVYVNFPGFHEDHEETMKTTFGTAYDRLNEVQQAYDPGGVFT